MNAKISIIIPTLNEEKYLPKLLESINKQNFEEYEIIVVDAKSKDKTVELARKFKKTRVIVSNKKGIGYQRNLGALYAKGDLLIFMDADIDIDDENLLNKIWEKYEKGYLSGTVNFDFYDAPEKYEKIKNILARYVWTYMKYIAKSYYGWFIFIDKYVYFKLGGFKELPSEDLEFSKRLSKFIKLKFFDDVKIKVSLRRMNMGLNKMLIYYFARDIETKLQNHPKILKTYKKIVKDITKYRKV